MIENKGLNESQYINKSDSAVLYGVAIVLMVFHHCFCDPERLMYDYIPLLGSFETESRIAWVGRLCVPIYAFISGYAFSVRASFNNELSIVRRIKKNIKYAIVQLFKFMTKFWFVYIIVILVGVTFFYVPLEPERILMGMITGGLEYCGEWWYVRQYIKFITLFPIIDIAFFTIFRERHLSGSKMILSLVGLFIIAFFLWKKIGYGLVLIVYNQVNVGYSMIFIIAYFIGYLRIYEKILSKIRVSILWNIVIVAFCIFFRWWYVKYASQHDCDLYLTPLFIFGFTGILHDLPMNNKGGVFFRFLGKYSTYIWLIHPFFLYYYFQQVVLLPKYSIIIFLWCFLISLLVSMLFDKMYRYLCLLCLYISENLGAKKTVVRRKRW